MVDDLENFDDPLDQGAHDVDDNAYDDFSVNELEICRSFK